MTDRTRRKPSSETVTAADVPNLLRAMLDRMDRMDASLEGLTNAYSKIGQHVALILQSISRCPPDCPHREDASADLSAELLSIARDAKRP
jgi:hypothetical protein